MKSKLLVGILDSVEMISSVKKFNKAVNIIKIISVCAFAVPFFMNLKKLTQS